MKPILNKHIQLRPLTEAELTDPALPPEYRSAGEAYRAYLAATPEKERAKDAAAWFLPWKVQRLSDQAVLGWLCFRGLPQNGLARLSGSLLARTGAAADPANWEVQAMKALVNWAFSRENVYFIRAAAEPEAFSWAECLAQAGFQEREPDRTGAGWEKERPASSLMATFLCLGLACGMSIGMSLGSMALGMGLGICCGMALGAALDSRDRKAREALRAALAAEEEA